MKRQLTKANGYTKTDRYFVAAMTNSGAVSRAVYEKNNEYFVEYDGKVRTVKYESTFKTF